MASHNPISGSGPATSLGAVRSDQIEARAVAKVVLVALFYAALALLLAIAILHTRTTLQWVATAIFLALALDPAVGLLQRIRIAGRSLPRVGAILAVYLVFLAGLVFLILHVFPSIVRDIEGLAKKLPTYVSDFEDWAEQQPAVPGPQRQVRHHPEAHRAGEQPALEAGQRCQRARLDHRQSARTPDRGDHGPHPDLLPPARRPGHVPAGHRAPSGAPARTGPARGESGRGSGPGLRQRQPGAGDRRRRPHLGLPRDRGLPSGGADGGTDGVPRPDPADRAHGRRASRWRWCW